MSVRRRAAKRDKNESEIVQALRNAGATVVQISEEGVADLLVGFRDQNWLMEVKAPKGELTEDQVKFRQNWRGQYAVVRTADEALALLDITTY